MQGFNFAKKQIHFFQKTRTGDTRHILPSNFLILFNQQSLDEGC